MLLTDDLYVPRCPKEVFCTGCLSYENCNLAKHYHTRCPCSDCLLKCTCVYTCKKYKQFYKGYSNSLDIQDCQENGRQDSGL